MNNIGTTGPCGQNQQQTIPSDSKLVERLKACQVLAVNHAREHFPNFFAKLEKEMEGLVEAAKSNQEQVRKFDCLRDLRRNREELERYFYGYLGEGYIKFKNGDLATETGEEKFRGDMLSLVDNDDLEETIAISSITHRAESALAEPLWTLNQRFSVLNGGEKIVDKCNPASPVQYCESLRKALKLLNLDNKSKILSYKLLDREFMPHLSGLLEETNKLLIKEGILPNLHYTPIANDGGTSPLPAFQADIAAGGSEPEVPASATAARTQTPAQTGMPGGAAQPLGPGAVAAPDPSLPSDQYQGNLVEAIRLLQDHMVQLSSASGHPAAPAGAVEPEGETTEAGNVVPGGAVSSRPLVIYNNQQLVGALQSMQNQALALTDNFQDEGGAIVAPAAQTVAEVNEQLTAQLRADQDGEMDSGDLHTIDLVGMLFEYMLSDDHLPSSVKALLSYLHTPFLKIAFIDKSFFEQSEHPARLLLNGLAEAGVRWVSNDGSSQYDIYSHIKNVVSRVLEEFKNDVRLFAELLLEFSAYTKKISQRQELMERRAMEKVQGEEKLREVKMRVNHEVRSRTNGRELPSAVLLLLLQPWSDYLAFLLLRYGDASDSWQRAIDAMDNVLWSIEPKESNADKARQMEIHDELLDSLETGFETIGYDQAKGKKLLDALFALQKMALQSKQVEPAPKPMRTKLETMAAERAGQEPSPKRKLTREEQNMVENLKMIEFGTWFEFAGGKRLKVAWYNSKTLHYMLVDQMGKKVAMKSGLELARAMLAGKARVIAGSSKPFFERALENIFNNLNTKAGAMQPGRPQ